MLKKSHWEKFLTLRLTAVEVINSFSFGLCLFIVDIFPSGYDALENNINFSLGTIYSLSSGFWKAYWSAILNFFSRENKEIRAQQARTSVETVKDVQKDSSLKSKAEKERRLREKHSNNTKIFIDERKNAFMRQEKRREKLKKQHEAQMNDLVKYVQNVSTFKNCLYFTVDFLISSLGIDK